MTTTGLERPEMASDVLVTTPWLPTAGSFSDDDIFRHVLLLRDEKPFYQFLERHYRHPTPGFEIDDLDTQLQRRFDKDDPESIRVITLETHIRLCERCGGAGAAIVTSEGILIRDERGKEQEIEVMQAYPLAGPVRPGADARVRKCRICNGTGRRLPMFV